MWRKVDGDTGQVCRHLHCEVLSGMNTIWGCCHWLACTDHPLAGVGGTNWCFEIFCRGKLPVKKRHRLTVGTWDMPTP